jgi:hypothetical protein
MKDTFINVISTFIISKVFISIVLVSWLKISLKSFSFVTMKVYKKREKRDFQSIAIFRTH